MDDRKLLELAAKSAGFTDAEWAADQASICTVQAGKGFMPFWNPLKDDGDALRLAVKLGIDVCFALNYVTARGSVQMPLDEYGNDPYAATRRAIVRAAAAIGEGMV